MTTFNISVTELKKALSIFSFIKRSETVVDYTFLQLEGQTNEPLQLTMSNNCITASTKVTAKIDSDFKIRVQLNDLLIMIRHMEGVVNCEITNVALIITNERIRHELCIIPSTQNYPVFSISEPPTILASLKPLLTLENIVLTPHRAIAYNNARNVVKCVSNDFNTTFTLTSIQAKFLSDLGNASLEVVENKLYIAKDDIRAIFLEQTNASIPPVDGLFSIVPSVKFSLTSDETKELQGLLHTDQLILIVKDGLLKIMATGTNTSTWQKKGITGNGFIKIDSTTLRDIVGNTTIGLLAVNNVTALRIDNGALTIFGAGLVR